MLEDVYLLAGQFCHMSACFAWHRARHGCRLLLSWAAAPQARCACAQRPPPPAAGPPQAAGLQGWIGHELHCGGTSWPATAAAVQSREGSSISHNNLATSPPSSARRNALRLSSLNVQCSAAAVGGRRFVGHLYPHSAAEVVQQRQRQQNSSSCGGQQRPADGYL